MKSFTATILFGIASAQSMWDDFKAQADMEIGNGDGELTWSEVAGGVEGLHDMEEGTLESWYGEDYDWENDTWFMTDFVSNSFDEDYDGLCAEECMEMNEVLELGLTMEEIEMGMDHYDFDGDGNLSIWEQDEIWHDLKMGSEFFGDNEDSDLYEWGDDWYYDWDMYYDYYDYYMDWYYDDDYYMDWYYDDYYFDWDY